MERATANIPLTAVPARFESSRIRTDVDGSDWDAALARLGGHPLQSAIWGAARQKCDGIESQHWLIERDGRPIWMARIETRRIPGIGRIAWVPRGPTVLPGEAVEGLPAGIHSHLSRAKFDVIVTDPWLPVENESAIVEPRRSRPRTIWLNLEVGQDTIWKSIHGKVRNGVRKADSSGVETRVAEPGSDVARFVEICRGIERSKKFDARVSVGMLDLLLQERSNSAAVETALLLAEVNRQIAAGVFVFRVGHSMSMLWAAADRSFSTERAGEAAHWAAIRWGLEHNCKLYDLEGIDRVRNPGVYRFKSRLGGQEVILPGRSCNAVSTLGRLLLPVVKQVAKTR